MLTDIITSITIIILTLYIHLNTYKGYILSKDSIEYINKIKNPIYIIIIIIIGIIPIINIVGFYIGAIVYIMLLGNVIYFSPKSKRIFKL